MLGRYLLADAIASGGMATIHLGRLLGPVGFARTVAIKRLHPQFAKDPEFVAAFLDEARLAARIQHPNVAQTLDVVATEGELFLVMEYVAGESLSGLLKRLRARREPMPPRIASAVVTQALYGLHAAHEAKSEEGEWLRLVHRDVSPHNILVGVDGAVRVVDFGIAKAAKRSHETEVGRIKGKIAYMSPEQARSQPLDRRSDVFAAGIVLWETLAGRRLFEDTDPFLVMSRVLEAPLEPPSRHAPSLPAEVDAVVMKALARDREARFQTARDMAVAIEQALAPALQREVGEWVEATVGDALAQRGQALDRLQREASDGEALPPEPPAVGDATADYEHSVVAEVQSEPATLVTTPMRVEPARAAPRVTRTVVLGIVVGTVLFALLVAAAFTATKGEPPLASASAVAPASAPPLPSASSPEVASELASAEPEPPRPAPPAPATTPKLAPRPPKPPAQCNPPYWVDGDGIKHYKKECRLK